MTTLSDGERDNNSGCMSYVYESLVLLSKQFRVFTLLPSLDKNAPLRGTLRIETFDTDQRDACPYEALSYVWGSENDPVRLYVEQGSIINITKNLAEALRYIRQRSQPRDLWIDALCIDQESTTEKNHQVRQMYQTFASATRVIIWLGLADEDSEYALTHLESLKTASRRNLSRIATIFQRPWSTRMWTFQEGLAANAESIVMCGTTIASWHNVLRALRDLLNSARSHPDASIHRLRYFLDVYTLHKTSQRLTLDKLIMASSNRQATDSRDYIYALLGLINDGQVQDIEPDYSQPVSVVFQKAMVNMFKSLDSIDLIVYGLCISESTNSWDSWHIHPRNRETCQNLGDGYLERRFGAVGGGAGEGVPLLDITHDVEKGTIKLIGTIVGRVGEVRWLCIPHEETREKEASRKRSTMPVEYHYAEVVLWLLYQINSIDDMARVQWRPYSSCARQKSADGDVWRIVANGRSMDYLLDTRPVPDDIYSDLAQFGKYACREIARHTDYIDDLIIDEGLLYQIVIDEYSPSGSHARLLRRILVEELEIVNEDFIPEFVLDALFGIARHVADGINIFTASRGYIGSTYGDVSAGDIVCRLHGCQVPLILREDDDGRYRIIGSAYVDGIMASEFFPAAERQAREREFVIK